MSGFKLIMAVSSDGFVARGPDDDMYWTGSTDKGLFKLLTTSGGVLLAGRVTAAMLPPLKHRLVVPLSRDPAYGLSLEQASSQYPGAWLIGGPAVAEEALHQGLVHQAYISQVPAFLGQGIPFRPILDLLPDSRLWQNSLVGDVRMRVYWGLDSGS